MLRDKNFFPERIMTSKNQYSYAIKQLLIDRKNRKYEVRYGSASAIAPKNSTTPKINHMIEDLKYFGFKEIKRRG